MRLLSQLAQFSQLEGITNMSTSLADVADVMRSDRIMAGANLVGKSVLAQTGRIATDGSTPSKIEVSLPYGAEQVDLGIYDADSGALIRSIVSGPQTSGIASFNWDGRIADGSAAPTGTYIIRGVATVNGSAQEFVPSTFTKVETVSWDAQTADLKLNVAGNVSIPISQVYRIGDDSMNANSKEQIDQAGDK